MKPTILVAFAFFSAPIACRTVGGDSAPAAVVAKQSCVPFGREILCANGKDFKSCKEEGLTNHFRCKVEEEAVGSDCMPFGREILCANGKDFKSCKEEGLRNHFRCKVIEEAVGSDCVPFGREILCANGKDFKSCEEEGLTNHFRCL